LEQGIHGMCAGEIRRLLIPADLGKQSQPVYNFHSLTIITAYGQMGLPNLVPGTKNQRLRKKVHIVVLNIYPYLENTAIIYEVEMLEVNSPFS
jgi:FK506-binding protein 2